MIATALAFLLDKVGLSGAAWIWDKIGFTGIALIICLLSMPVVYERGKHAQALEDNVAAKDADLARLQTTLDKYRDDASRVLLKQAQATGRERDLRIAAERHGQDLESEARETERQLADAANFTCPPPAVAPAPNAVIVQAVPAIAVPRLSCAYSDRELSRLREAFPAARLPSGAAPAGGGDTSLRR
jgi:hypothetical protein